MKSYTSTWSVAGFCFAALALGLLSASAANASTVTLVSDAFSTGSVANGRTPDIGPLPGSKWVSSNGISGGQLVVGADTATVISIASAGAYTKPTMLTISADLDLNGMTAGSSLAAEGDTAGTVHAIPRGITLGFFNPLDSLGVTPTAPTNGGFEGRRGAVGITYNDLGYLLLIKQAVDAPTVATILATVGPDSTHIPLSGSHHLQYTVDTTTGSISNVTFNGFAVDFGFDTAGLFTDAATNYAGSYAAAGSTGNGFVDNFLITAEVPEPASLGLLAAGGLLLLRRRRVRFA